MSKLNKDLPYSTLNPLTKPKNMSYQDPYKSSSKMARSASGFIVPQRTNPMKSARPIIPKQPSNVLGRDQKIDPDLYYRVKDENEELKKTKLEMNDRIKKMEVELANIKSNLVKERKLSDRKVIKMDKGYDLDLESTKLENDKLKEQNTKLRTYIKGLQSDNKLRTKNKLRPYTTALNNPSKNPLHGQKEKNESLALIAHLRNEIKDLQDDRKSLVSQLLNFKTQKVNPNQKNQMSPEQITNLETNNLKMESNYQMMELYKKGLNDYKSKYEDERQKNQSLQNKIDLLQNDLENLNQYKALVDDYKQKERVLENRIQELCESPFIKQTEERGNIYRKYQQNEMLLKETEQKLRELEDKVRLLDSENKTLKKNLDLAVIERDKSKEDLMRIKISSEEKEKNKKIFEDNLNLFGNQFSGMESNFVNTLDRMYDINKNNPWNNMNLIPSYTSEQIKDPEFLFKETERLKIEKGILGQELDKTKYLLQQQQEINEGLNKLRDCDLKKSQIEIKNYKKKIEELCKLVDIERLPKEFLHGEAGKTKIVSRAELLNELGGSVDKGEYLNDAITEFSQDSTEPEFSINENALDIYFGECEYESGLEDQIGMTLNKLMSFISVDFFIHETQTSNVSNGANPMINFQITFRVNVDEHFLNFLESDYLGIEVYYLRDNVQSILGKGKIPLNELILAEKNNKATSRVINSVCTIYYAKDDSLKVGSIHYKMRMRNPISEMIKYYYEQNKFIGEVNPLQDVISKNADKKLKDMTYSGQKVYQVKILISKANNIVISGPPRKILPYFYYRFYENDEKYSKVSMGNNPEFQDVSTYVVSYDHALHDYIEKDNLNVYIFDSSEPIEVDVSNKDKVKLVDDNNVQDIIGVCRIPLRGLLIKDLIQGTFPIENTNGQNVGELAVNIFWEEVMINKNEVKFRVNDVNMENNLKQKSIDMNVNQSNSVNQINTNAMKSTNININQNSNLLMPNDNMYKGPIQNENYQSITGGFNNTNNQNMMNSGYGSTYSNANNQFGYTTSNLRQGGQNAFSSVNAPMNYTNNNFGYNNINMLNNTGQSGFNNMDHTTGNQIGYSYKSTNNNMQTGSFRDNDNQKMKPKEEKMSESSNFNEQDKYYAD